MPDNSGSFETHVLDTLKQAQDVMVETVRAWVDAVHRTLPDVARTSELRYVDRLPDPARLIGEVFDFAEALLKSQREFALELLEATEPLTRSAGMKVGERSTSVRSPRARPATRAKHEAASKDGPRVRSA